MTNSMRIRIAGIATALSIAALSVTGLAVRGHQPAQAPAPASAVAQQSQRSAPTSDEHSEVPATADVEDDGGWEIDDD